MKTRLEFSKILLIQESVLIWINTLAYIVLAFYCIKNQYLGTLPWLTAGASLPWVAYGTSQGFYYNKSKKENSKDGIKYELALKEAEALYNIPADLDNLINQITQPSESDTKMEENTPIDLDGPI